MTFPLSPGCFPNYLHNQFSYFTLLGAPCSVKPSLTIWLKLSPSPLSIFLLSFVSFSACIAARWCHLHSCVCSPSLPLDWELSKGSICIHCTHSGISSARIIAGM